MKNFSNKFLAGALASALLVSSSANVFMAPVKASAPASSVSRISGDRDSRDERPDGAAQRDERLITSDQAVDIIDKKSVGQRLKAFLEDFGNISWKDILKQEVTRAAVSICTHLFYSVIHYGSTFLGDAWDYLKYKWYGGFRSPLDCIQNLESIVNNTSNIRVYGQERAKDQIFEALSGTVARIDNIKQGNIDVKEVRGNIIYLIGPSGTGKTKMCNAIAEAFLKHPNKTAIFCHSESITSETELGEQLFKTIYTKDIGKKHKMNIWTGQASVSSKEEESPMLKHLLTYYESVVIIDEYDKMKAKSKPRSSGGWFDMDVMMGGQYEGSDQKVDNSADEIFRSIASTGKYKFMNAEVDCSKTLFLVTTNETREELEKNFGIGGVKGGGVQRLNVAEFDYLPLEACRGIVNDMVAQITKILENKSKKGTYKLNSVTFDEDTMQAMAEYVFNDKVMQGRARYKLEDKIYSLFAKDIGKDCNKNFKVSFKYSGDNENVRFVKEEI